MSGSKSQKFEMEMGYQTTLMYGRYTQSLGDYAKQMAADIKKSEAAKKRTARKEKQRRIQELHSYRGKWSWRLVRIASFVWRHTFAKIGEDWVFLALLGMIMAVLSFMIDYGSFMCHTARVWLYRDISTHPAVQYVAWVSLPVSLVLFSSGFVYLLAPQAVGSGIPEMKTVLRGVVLSEYLTFRTLVAKVVGLTATLGSGMPVGKEGPLVHIASIVATLMSKLVTSFKGIYENESRSNEMLAAACAVGVSCCVGAPIGGVLFSIETTSVYFAIRNYWRGFFSAVFGALMFRLLAYWFDTEETLTAIFSTNFQVDFAYDPHELLIYALVGVFGGLSGAFFVLCHRKYVLFMRNTKWISTFLQKNRFIYPGLLSLVIASLYFPLGLGKFLAPTLTTRQQIISLFSNFSWINEDLTVRQAEIVSHWTNDQTNMFNLFTGLGIYMITTFFLTLLASTLPVPSGSLIPIFKIGAAFGRIIGEAAGLWFPNGFRLHSATSNILPGGYAIVGSAAFSSGVTHAISICVIVCEMTGQIKHIIPVLVAVLVSNAISTLLQPSLYDSIIMIKKLPYLPSILPSSSAAYSVFVEHFMRRNVKYIWHGISYRQLKDIIKENAKIRSFPLVDDPENMILLGSIQRGELISLIERQIGHARRLEAVKLREQSRSSLDIAPQNSIASPFLTFKPESAPVASIENDSVRVAKFSIAGGSPVASVEALASEDVLHSPKSTPSDEGHDKASLSPVTTKTNPTRKISRFEVVKTSDILMQDQSSNKAKEEKDEESPEESAGASQPLLQVEAPTTSALEREDDASFVISSNFKERLSHATSMLHHHNTQSAQPEPAHSNSEIHSNATGNNAINLLLQQPKKSILKKTSSFTFTNSAEQPDNLVVTDTAHLMNNYTTITGAEGSNFFKSIGLRRPTAPFTHHHERSGIFHLTSLPSFKKVTLPKERVIDMSPEEQKQWEEEEMAKPVDLNKSCRIDPAPFQLVERTSLLKVHSMFSLLGVHHAYVTTIGRLTGIVSLQELRKAIEDVNSGVLTGSSSFSSSSYDVITHDRQSSIDDGVPGAPVEDIETADQSDILSSSSDEDET